MTNAGLPTGRPSHVAETDIYEFDIFHDRALLEDPHGRVQELTRTAPPIFWTPRNGGHWVVTMYEDVHKVLAEPETFSSSPLSPERKRVMLEIMSRNASRAPEPTPILMDPPTHTRYRAPLQKVFSPQAIMKLKGEIEYLANELIDQVIDGGRCDFISAVAEPLPVQIFLKMMGLPLERLRDFRTLVHEMFAPVSDASDPTMYGKRLRNIADAMMDVILARRSDPKDDLISQLWGVEIEGQAMTLELMEDYTTLLFLAGLDTVTNAIGFGMRHLAGHPELQSELRKNPTLIPSTLEDLFRRYTFVIPRRRVTADTQIRGKQLRAGDTVQLYLPAVGLNPREDASRAAYNAAHRSGAHLFFGGGAHRCVGERLARLELLTFYRVVFQRLPPFRLNPDKPATFNAGTILSVTSLPLCWD